MDSERGGAGGEDLDRGVSVMDGLEDMRGIFQIVKFVDENDLSRLAEPFDNFGLAFVEFHQVGGLLEVDKGGGEPPLSGRSFQLTEQVRLPNLTGAD